MKEILLKVLHAIFGHPQEGNIYIGGIDTYCTCGRKNLP